MRADGGVTLGDMAALGGPATPGGVSDGRGYGWVSLTTDYGLSDGFVAVCHGVLARAAPAVRVLDITHLVPPGDVSAGAAVLAQTVPHLPIAIHIAIVDPGVGTARRGVALDTERGVLVGPDNGLLMAAADALGGVRRAVELTNSAWFAPAVSATFHGRDIFAPVAARLATGADLAGAGEALDPGGLCRLPDPMVVIADGVVEAEVVQVDRFGNVQLAAAGEVLATLPAALHVGGEPAVRGRTFADARPGELVAYQDSAGRLAVAVNGGQADRVLGAAPGDVVRLTGR